MRRGCVSKCMCSLEVRLRSVAVRVGRSAGEIDVLCAVSGIDSAGWARVHTLSGGVSKSAAENPHQAEDPAHTVACHAQLCVAGNTNLRQSS